MGGERLERARSPEFSEKDKKETFLRTCLVSGYRRVPAPPPRMTAGREGVGRGRERVAMEGVRERG